MFEVIQALSLTVLFVVLFLAIVAASEFGNVVGRRYGRETDSDKDAGAVATATLGLLALLIAFTYAMAVARYDLRRQVVLEEANAIGSTANFALMLPSADQKPILDDLRAYTELRIRLGSPAEPEKLAADVRRSGELRADLWRRAVAVASAAPQSIPVYQFTASLNETNNIGEKRLTALRNHVPAVITVMLGGTALVAMGFSGYGAGVIGVRRRFSNVVLALLIAALISIVIDLQRPDQGSIRVPVQPLQDTLAAFPPG